MQPSLDVQFHLVKFSYLVLLKYTVKHTVKHTHLDKVSPFVFLICSFELNLKFFQTHKIPQTRHFKYLLISLPQNNHLVGNIFNLIPINLLTLKHINGYCS